MVRPVSVVPEASFNVAESVFVSPTRRLAELGETATLATAGSETTIAAESRCPSLVAKIHALPAATPVTAPDDETVATLLFPLDHVMERPVSVFPFASSVVAASVTLLPTSI
jgi:hypothetical protein